MLVVNVLFVFICYMLDIALTNVKIYLLTFIVMCYQTALDLNNIHSF